MKVVLYRRVSTQTQGRSGLGIEAQELAVRQFCAERACDVIGDYVEIESGKRDSRPELVKALHTARITGATLVVAKLCRLSRNVAFLAQLQDSGVKFIATDMPFANELTIHVMAAVAQAERKATSIRTQEALRARKARGLRLGNPNGAQALRRAQKGNTAALATVKANADRRARDIEPILRAVLVAGDCSYRRVANELNSRGIMTARQGKWHPATAKALMDRLGLVAA